MCFGERLDGGGWIGFRHDLACRIIVAGAVRVDRSVDGRGKLGLPAFGTVCAGRLVNDALSRFLTSM